MDPRGTHETSTLQLPWIRIVFDAAEIWCLKAKKIAKLKSTDMDFWRLSARISRKDEIMNTVITQNLVVDIAGGKEAEGV